MLSSAKEPFSRAEVKPGSPALSCSGRFVELAVSDSKAERRCTEAKCICGQKRWYFAISQRGCATNIVARRNLLVKVSLQGPRDDSGLGPPPPPSVEAEERARA